MIGKRKETVEELEARMNVLHWTIDVDDHQWNGPKPEGYDDWLAEQAARAFAHEIARIGAMVRDVRVNPALGPMRKVHFEMCVMMPNATTEQAMKLRLDDDLAQLDGPPPHPASEWDKAMREAVDNTRNAMTASELTLLQRAKDREVAAAGQRLLKEASEKFPPSTKLAPYKP